MINDKQLPRSIEVTFYIKPRAKRITTLRKVRVTLNNVIRVRDAISVILKCAELPTSYVDSLPDLVIKFIGDPITDFSSIKVTRFSPITKWSVIQTMI